MWRRQEATPCPGQEAPQERLGQSHLLRPRALPSLRRGHNAHSFLGDKSGFPCPSREGGIMTGGGEAGLGRQLQGVGWA